MSILDTRVCGGSHDGMLAVHSLSKRSNLAGYRAGFALGDPALVGSLLEARKHLGLMVPAPVQAAAIAALGDDAHVAEQRERYAPTPRPPALGAARRRVHASSTPRPVSTCGSRAASPAGTPCAWFAERGILVAPGEFYGVAGAQHVRVALTATDERVAAAVRRLAA